MTEYERASLTVPFFVGLLQCGLIAWGISKMDKSDEGRDVLLTALKDQSSVGHWGGLAESIGRHSGAAERAGRGSSAPAGIVPINCSGDTLLHGHERRASSASAVAARGRQTQSIWLSAIGTTLILEVAMIIGAKNEKLYPKWASWIKDLQTLGAFQYLVGLAATSDKFDCEANETGNKKLFSFRRKGQREEPYAFITNQGWLLFYFRSPALKSGIHSKERLAQDFSSFDDNPNQRCEWTIKLCSIADVKRLLAHVDLK